MSKRCFVITPIGDDTSSIRRHIDGIIEASIMPALEPEYEVIVAHKISEPGTITKQIITEIYKDDLVIANLTNNNANVMYELAFRHSLGKPVITIAEKGTSLPSDIIMERTIFYQNDALGTLDLRAELKKAVDKIDFDKKCSPIYDIIHEIDADANIIEFAKQTAGKDTDLFSHILTKLNAIERMVEQSKQSSRPLSSISATMDRVYKFMFTYGVKPDGLIPADLVSLLQKQPIFSRVRFVDLSWDAESRMIIISITSTLSKRLLNELSHAIADTLIDAGFSDVACKNMYSSDFPHRIISDTE